MKGILKDFNYDISYHNYAFLISLITNGDLTVVYMCQPACEDIVLDIVQGFDILPIAYGPLTDATQLVESKPHFPNTRSILSTAPLKCNELL